MSFPTSIRTSSDSAHARFPADASTWESIGRPQNFAKPDPIDTISRFIADFDQETQRSLDRIVGHCVDVFSCEIALVTALDVERQTFLASVGVDETQTPREQSFCQYAVADHAPLLVIDARKDERFHELPLVVQDPKIVSYMGCPVKLPNGALIGTVCVADSRPGRFTEKQLPVLKRLAHAVEVNFKKRELLLEKTALLAEVENRNRELSATNRLFRQAEKVAMLGSWEVDIKSSRIIWSDQVFTIYGEEGQSQATSENALRFYTPDEQTRIRQRIAKTIATGEPLDFEADITTRAGISKRVRVKGELEAGNPDGSAKLVGVCQDITDFHQTKTELERAARYDSLTGLLNRYGFDRIVQARMSEAKNGGEPVSIIMIDLDGFKDINDKFGHVVGDVVLEDIGDRIARATPPEAVAARWGGDEFAIVLPSTLGASQEALEIARNLIAEIEYQTEIAGHRLELGATAGVVCSVAGISAKELVRRADTALYFGKRREPGTAHAYRKHMEEENFARQKAIEEVQSALRGERIYVGYQPILDMTTGDIAGFEALMRLTSITGDRLTAGQVLPALVAPVISRKIGKRMLGLIGDEFAQLEQGHPSLGFVSINASETDLLSQQFARNFLANLRQKGVEPAKVILEITETMLLVEDARGIRETLLELREAGVKIALDDFGTGYSSLSHLRDFPIDKVKIDGSFVRSLPTTPSSRTIVKALIQMADGLKLDIIAEGIETEEQMEILIQMGCRHGQGFLFGAAQDVGRISLNKFTRNPTSAA